TNEDIFFSVLIKEPHGQSERLAGETKKRPQARRLKEHFESAVEGFIFPLQSEDDVDRLEWNVRENQEIRDQYVAFLQNVKLFRQDLANVFTDLFADEALLGYNYYGKTNRAKKKKAMKKYIIFTDCMIDAWHTHGVNEEVLRISIVKVIARLNHKLRSRGYRRKPVNVVLLDDDDDAAAGEVELYEVA
ncbi:uncharacterized protein LOC135697346, partial [Ochlerotatus camptorhynchus]|uniref:uncharacterized protein LOC135697346 n=1 Tax=Ochlerotatus camptorhynchus TaxID=644619 RepID=UPI0031E22D3C